MSTNSSLMGLKAGLLALLMLWSFGITEAVRQQRAEDVRVSKAPPPSSVLFLRPDSSFKAASGKGVRRLIGSSAPECGHTCGACLPCLIQVVSYECSEALELHAEACPLGYLCICHGRSFPIP